MKVESWQVNKLQNKTFLIQKVLLLTKNKTFIITYLIRKSFLRIFPSGLNCHYLHLAIKTSEWGCSIKMTKKSHSTFPFMKLSFLSLFCDFWITKKCHIIKLAPFNLWFCIEYFLNEEKNEYEEILFPFT